MLFPYLCFDYHFSAFRWGKGFGIIGPLLGEDHFLNQRNVIYGVAFYCVLMALGNEKKKTGLLCRRIGT